MIKGRGGMKGGVCVGGGQGGVKGGSDRDGCERSRVVVDEGSHRSTCKQE